MEYKADKQTITLVIKRYADDEGSWYDVYTPLGLEAGQEPIGEGPDLETALHNAQVHSRFMASAQWVG